MVLLSLIEPETIDGVPDGLDLASEFGVVAGGRARLHNMHSRAFVFVNISNLAGVVQNVTGQCGSRGSL